jgi:hypothetical protein
MTKEGFENIEFVELPGEMTKEDAFKTVMAADLAARRGLTIPTAETVADAGDGTVDGDQRMVA